MVITKNINWNIYISDIETCCELIDLGFYNPDTDKWYEFEISKYKNNLYEFVKFYNKTNSNIDYIVYYNGINFDAQVIQYILNNYEKWINLANLEIVKEIYIFVQKLIADNKSVIKPFKESSFEIPVIDVFTLLGLNNAARFSSLKKIEFQLDMDNIEEMPIHHSKENLTEGEIDIIKDYRKNDVLATLELFNLCLGNTEHPLYKGNNQIELRIDLKEEFGINCISYSEIKIGDELMKVKYLEATGLKEKELSRTGFFRKEIKLAECIPSYIKFESKELQQLLKETKKIVVKQVDKYEKTFSFGALKTKYTIGLGGGHSVNSNQIFETNETHSLIDVDVASLYPALAVNLNLYPKHLGKELLKVYTELYYKRIELKPLAKTDKKIKGITDGIKLILNSAYGKFGSLDSWMFDKKVAYTICLAGQFSLLMLVEQFEKHGIKVFYLNTDGVTTIVPNEQMDKFKEICKEWEKTTNLILEESYYKKMLLADVNNYIAIDNKDKIKKKGLFLTDHELWKNKSYKIVSLALEQYFINKVNPISFIEQHENIFDYCIMAKATGKLHLEEQYFDNKGKLIVLKHKKLIRYYLSNTGNTLYKRGIGNTGKLMNNHINAPNGLGNQYIQYFNSYKKQKNYSIDYKHYILKCLNVIDKIEKTRKAQQYINSLKPQKQTAMF